MQRAKALQTELTAWRRYLHENAETGFDLEKTMAFIKGELEKMGYSPQKCGKAGLIATIGKGGKTFLLRADTDALPMKEETGVDFACKSGNMHACGHDMHAAMLLGAAKLLKAREKVLQGKVKLLFQPAEEILEGAKDVIDAGALKGVDGAMTLHVMTNVALPMGVAVVAKGVSAPAADYFTIRVRGKSCHGSTPWKGVDALTAAAHILLALQEISARELSHGVPVTLTIGEMKAGTAGNVIPDLAKMKGTLRAFDEKARKTVKLRMEEIVGSVAKAFRASAEVIYGGCCPTLVNDEELSAFAERTAKELMEEKFVFNSQTLNGDTREQSGGSEDFAYISHEAPSVMIALAAGETEKGHTYPLHHPKVKFDEAALPIGAALYAHIAMQYFKKG